MNEEHRKQTGWDIHGGVNVHGGQVKSHAGKSYDDSFRHFTIDYGFFRCSRRRGALLGLTNGPFTRLKILLSAHEFFFRLCLGLNLLSVDVLVKVVIVVVLFF